jgi:hypothetical protein
MPWLFLTLRRALIPTLCLVILAVLFYGVPQSSEVLFGLTEPVSNSVSRGDFVSSVNFYPLVWYVVWSFLLSGTIWYSARLLCTVEARLGMPFVWEVGSLRPSRPAAEAVQPAVDPQTPQPDDPKPGGEAMPAAQVHVGENIKPTAKRHPTERHIRFAIKWLPRVYGVAGLAAAMGALIFATLTSSTLSRIAALGLVAALVAAPIMIAAGAVGIGREGSWRRIVCVVVFVFGIVLYVIMANQLPDKLKALEPESANTVRWVDTACAALPAVLLLMLLFRRELTRIIYKALKHRNIEPGRFLGRILFLKQPELDYDDFESSHEVTFEEVFPQVLAFIALGIIGLICLNHLSVKHVRAIGSAGTVMSFLAAAVVFISGVQLFLRRISRAVPGFTSALLILVVVLLQIFSVEQLGNETIQTISATSATQKVPVAAAPSPAPAQPAAPAASGQPFQHVIVNAYGGGLRAAIYTAQVLALADDATCGAFGEHLHALSGVSGGSVGIAVYLVARQHVVKNGLYNDCVPGAKSLLTDYVTAALVKDHLSPVIAKLLSRDIFFRTHATPPTFATRGQALLDSWDDALAQALEPNATEPVHPLGELLANLDGGIQPMPRVFFNTTDADTGRNEWFSNGAPKPNRDASNYSSFPVSQAKGTFGMSVGQAILHSARFPFVSPAGSYMVDKVGHRLVDGGYADNSGTQTLLSEVIKSAKAAYGENIVLLDINGNPPDPDPKSIQPADAQGKDDDAQPKLSSLATAVLALLQARSAHAENAVVMLGKELPECKKAAGGAACPTPIQLSLERVRDVQCGNSTSNDNKLTCQQVEKARTAPLGWYTGAGASRLVAKSSWDGANKACEKAKIQCQLPKLAQDVQGNATVQVGASVRP